MTTSAERRRVLRRWDGSGLAAHDFAPVVGAPALTLDSWRCRERRSAPAFVELAIASEPAAESGVAPPIEIALSRGVVPRIHAGFDPDTLRRAVDVLIRSVREVLARRAATRPQPSSWPTRVVAVLAWLCRGPPTAEHALARMRRWRRQGPAVGRKRREALSHARRPPRFLGASAETEASGVSQLAESPLQDLAWRL